MYLAIVGTLDYVLDGLTHSEAHSVPLLATVTAQARRAAWCGFSLDTVLRRYQAAEQKLAAVILQEVSHDSSPDSLAATRLILRLHALINELTIEIAAAHQHEVSRDARSPEERRTERIRALLRGSSFDTSGLEYEFDLAWHVCVIAVGSQARRVLREIASALGKQLLLMQSSEEIVYAWLGGDRVIGVGDLESAPHRAEARGVMLVLGEPAQGVQGWRVTHRQAQAALRVALYRPRTITKYADVALLAQWVPDEAVARAFTTIHLSPLSNQRDKGVTARETLRAYFDAGHQIEAAAHALGINRGTLRARLATIEAALGYQVHEHQAELEVALRVEALYDTVSNAARVSLARRLEAPDVTSVRTVDGQWGENRT